MVSWNLSINRDITYSELLRITGGFVAVFSLVMGLLVLFVLPASCSFLGGLELLILIMLFLMGGVGYLVGEFLVRRKS
jgi:predicted membrane channel-forming protein YqfA (hemolysin III family)